MTQSTSSVSAGGRLDREGTEAPLSNKLVQAIFDDPVGFIFKPNVVSQRFPESILAETHRYFSVSESTRYVYSVSSAFFHKRFPQLDAQLLNLGLTDSTHSRFWPFWKADDLNHSQSRNQDDVEDYLTSLWNRPPDEYPSMFHQTGRLHIEERARLGDDVFIFKAGLPIYRNAHRRPATITFAFDSRTQGYYTINARVRFEAPEFRFRYVEFIKPNLVPPKVATFLAGNEPKQWKVLLVLDRHIGDNLSLLSTHVRFLASIKNFELTIDTSLCPLFGDSKDRTIDRFLPQMPVNLTGPLPFNRADYDLVFDPYDWVGGVFDLKPQNDSTAVGFVSGLELARCTASNNRRDILDIHMSSLKRLGIVSFSEPKAEFIRYRVSPEERAFRRRITRSRLFGDALSPHRMKLVVLFPFGKTSERRYPTDPLQFILQNLLTDPDVRIVIAGAEFDTEEVVQALRSDWPGVAHPCRHRVQVYLNERLPALIDLMLSSDALVCMDSGPLHIARALRLNPIALYTAKVNNPEFLLSFPWLVEDGTAEALKPEPGNDHVNPDVIVTSVRLRLTRCR